jgi:hypothetical protein
MFAGLSSSVSTLAVAESQMSASTKLSMTARPRKPRTSTLTRSVPTLTSATRRRKISSALKPRVVSIDAPHWKILARGFYLPRGGPSRGEAT